MAASPARKGIGERRKWRPVRRKPAADEKNDFRNFIIGVLRILGVVGDTDDPSAAAARGQPGPRLA
ncbi:hypothetical protein ADE_02110 [Achromobacter denitrificans]|nr:hypothetical protein ADE_02110 [Achromobacter denitrificans]